MGEGRKGREDDEADKGQCLAKGEEEVEVVEEMEMWKPGGWGGGGGSGVGCFSRTRTAGEKKRRGGGGEVFFFS